MLPPVLEVMLPPVLEVMLPPVLEVMLPPVLEVMLPPVLEVMLPPMLEVMLPPVLEVMRPPVLEVMLPPVLEVMLPPVLEVMLPPVLEVMLPPVLEVMLPPVLEVMLPPVLVVSVVAVLVHDESIGELSPVVSHTAPPIMVGCSIVCFLSSPVLPGTVPMPPVLVVSVVAVLVHDESIGELSPVVSHTAPPIMVGCSIVCFLSSPVLPRYCANATCVSGVGSGGIGA